MSKFLRQAGIGAGVVAGLLALFIGLGLRPGANTARASLEIGRPAGEVWSWLHEPARLKIWVAGVLEVRQESPTRQIWVMEDRNNNNARMEMSCDITEDDRPRRMKLHMTVANSFEGDTMVVLTPFGSARTKVELSGTFYFDDWLVKLMTPVAVYSTQQRMAEDLTSLKVELEKVP
jgi:uncharacterized protein YndB with AHSA1/START domain